jgi:hypothetical protein
MQMIWQRRKQQLSKNHNSNAGIVRIHTIGIPRRLTDTIFCADASLMQRPNTANGASFSTTRNVNISNAVTMSKTNLCDNCKHWTRAFDGFYCCVCAKCHPGNDGYWRCRYYQPKK